jgi:hypothetical protein
MAEPVRARRLTDQEGQRLLQIVRRGKHESVRVRRVMIIMASASGTLVPAIARWSLRKLADYLAEGAGVCIGRERLPAQAPGEAARDLPPHPRHPLLPRLLLRGR